jgi:imidazolonepropionase-like amidohydrolase
MRSARWVPVAFLSLWLIGCSTQVDPAITTVLTGVTVIDGTGDSAIRDAIIALAEDSIVFVGASSVAPRAPHNAAIIDLTDHWIVPGFIDMHAHLDGGRYAPKFLAQLVAFGITAARAPSNPSTELRERVRSGELIGPRLFLSGGLINGPSSFFGQRGETEQDYREIVARDAERGVEFVKVYAGVPPHLTRAVIDEAHRHGLRVIGHLGETTWTEAAEAGIDALTHSWYAGLAHSVVPAEHRAEFAGFYIPPGAGGFDPALFARWREVVSVDGPDVLALADLLVARGIDVDPTLVLGEAMTWGNDPAALERLEPDLAMPGQAETWRADPFPYSSSWTDEQFAEAQAAWPMMLDIIRVFHERGVLLTAGTDLLNPWMTPGVTFHRELELLVAAGIPPLDVLSIATRNGASALGILDETGTVEAGKRANFVVLGADPLAAITNTRSIVTVYLNGIAHDPRRLMEVARDVVSPGKQ